jgi:hypothetical protein
MNNYDDKLNAAGNRLRVPATGLDSLVDAVLQVGHLVQTFSRVKRSVPFDRKGTQESDPDHTVLLSLGGVLRCGKVRSRATIGSRKGGAVRVDPRPRGSLQR